MNERIKELAEQAEVWKGVYTGFVFDKEKFAELIVRECAQVGFDYNGGTVCEIYAVILEHFGVEE